MTEPKDHFKLAAERLERSLKDAVSISESRIGIFHTGRQNRVLFTFSKSITHAMSIQLISGRANFSEPGSCLLDHFSIATLTRTLVDTTIMVLYLSEPSLSLDQWDLRRHVLFLHDLSNRRRFLGAMRKFSGKPDPENDEADFAIAKSKITERIRECGAVLSLPRDRIDNLCKGQAVFLDGLRGAVREAGQDVNYFDFLYAYLSNHVHSHPGSYIRAESQKVSFDTPSEFQLNFCSLCLEAGTDYLDAATARVKAFTGNVSLDPLGVVE